MNTKNMLLTQINQKRNEMIELGLVKGLTSEETVKCSQELDELLNMYRNNIKNKYFSKIAV